MIKNVDMCWPFESFSRGKVKMQLTNYGPFIEKSFYMSGAPTFDILLLFKRNLQNEHVLSLL